MLTWPYNLTPNTISAQPTARNARGGTSLSGVSQVISNRLAVWRVRYEGFSIQPDQVHLWRSLQARLRGMDQPILIPIWEQYRIPGDGSTPDYWTYPDQVRIPFSDGAYFADGSGFYEALIKAKTTAPIARGAVTASIDMDSKVLMEGAIFSIEGRAYMVAEILSQSGDVYQIKFWPTAREAVATGVHVEFERPHVKVRLARDDAMDLPLEMNRFGTASVDFIEDLS